MPSPKNLMPSWGKGESGNPNGRPKGAISLVKLLNDLLNKEIDHPDYTERDEHGAPTRKKMTVAQGIVLALVAKAIQGDTKALQMIMERTDGKVLEMLSSAVETIDMTPQSMTFDEAYELKYGKKPKRRKKRSSSKD